MLRSLTYFHYLYGDDTALNHVRQFAAAAGALGCQVNTHALNLGNQHIASGQAGAKSKIRGALKKRFSRILHEPKELAWNARYLSIELRTLRRERPPALLVRDNLYSTSYVLAAKMAGLPLVIEVNSPAAESRIYRHDYAHLPLVPEYLERTKLRHADAIMAVSSPLRTHLIEQSGIDPSRVHVVLNGADVEKFSPSVKPDPDVAALVNDSPVVGFVGSFAEWHNPELLGRMAVHVSTRCPQARFVFVGDGDGLPRVKDITAEIGDRMVFTGRVPHGRVPGLVRLFDVGVLADTAFYCCPLKILEWMAAGVPVVAPDYASVRDIINDGVNGTLFPPKDYDAMAASIADLLATPERCETLGKAASAKIRGQLTWKHNAGRVLAICEEAANAYAARRGGTASA